MLTITKPEVSLRTALIERETAMRKRRQAIREEHRYVRPETWDEDYYYLLGAEWTYAQAAAEAGFNHDGGLSLSVAVELATMWFGIHVTGEYLAAAERGRQFALSIIRGLELK